MPTSDELIRLSAVEAVARLKAGDVSPLEMVETSIARIEAVDDQVNALPIHAFDRARAQAKAMMAEKGAAAASGHPAWLAGLPIAIKDLMDVEGLPTTYGCPMFANNIAARSDVMVRLLEARGAIVVAKSNTPEFGMLPVTDNRVFGATASPWHTGKTAGGSSGGAAAAVGSGQVWLAHGSDIGGSLRIPAACCGVVGIRPSPGRVPRNFSKRGFSPMAVQGPHARTVADAALFLDAQTAYSHHDPLTLDEVPGQFTRAVADAKPPVRKVAFTADFGMQPVDPAVTAIVRKAAATLEGMGVVIEEATPDLGDMQALYLDMIALNLLTEREAFVAEHRDKLEPVQVMVVENALKLTPQRIAAAERARSEMFERVATFFDDYDLILSPTLGVPPFDKTERGPRTDGWAQTEPPAWFQQCWGTVLTSSPIVSILAGLTDDGLPLGLQVMAPVRQDARAIATAHLIEQALGLTSLLPLDPRRGAAK